MELNASDERGIDIVRNNIKNFARMSSVGGAQFKIIFLDEADALTPDAQAALRRTMERYSQTCRFILSCNYSSRIIVPIQSRCAVYRFRPLGEDSMMQRILEISRAEELDISEDAVKAMIFVSQGDMRKAVNTLQSAAVMGKKIIPDAIYEITATARPEEIRELINLALDGELLKSIDRLTSMLVEKGLSGEDITAQMHREILGMENLTDKKKVELLDHIGEIEFRLTEGANERIQLDALIAHLVLSGGK